MQSAKELEQLYPQFTTDLAWETTKASGVLFKSGLMQALELLGLTDGSIYGETYHKLFVYNKVYDGADMLSSSPVGCICDVLMTFSQTTQFGRICKSRS